MSGIYEISGCGDQPPAVAPVGALGDIGAALFATIGILTALRHRDRTGVGQHVDIAMFDALVAMTDIVTNFWSMGLRNGELGPLIMHGFRASDGWFVLQVGREAQFEQAGRVDRPPRVGDRRAVRDPPGLARPPRRRAAPRDRGLGRVEGPRWRRASGSAPPGIAAGPCFRDEEVVHDQHVANRNMLVEVPRTDGVDQPVLVPGNPVRMTRVQQGPETRVPWLGEHTDDGAGERARSRRRGDRRAAGLRHRRLSGPQAESRGFDDMVAIRALVCRQRRGPSEASAPS